MKKLLTLATSGAIGYVAGARAGRDRYDSLLRGARAVWDGWPRDVEGRRSVNPRGLVGTGRIPPATRTPERDASTTDTETPPVVSALNDERRSSPTRPRPATQRPSFIR